jgi:hypothetical protein
MNDEERRKITERARAYANSEREFIPDGMRAREQIDPEDAEHEHEIAAECRRAYDAWSANAAADPGEPAAPEPPAAPPPADEGREFNMELVGDLIAEVMGQFVAEQVRAAKVEMLTEINSLRLEFIKEQSEFVRQQKIMLNNVRELLSKIQRREFGGEEAATSLN